MRENTLNLLGLMRRANAIAIGETNTGAAVKSGKARLLLTASDASDNARHRVAGFSASSNVPEVSLPFTKAEISARVGLNGCSMAAVLDLGFSAALMKNLAAMYPNDYGDLALTIEERNVRARRRRDGAAAREKNKRNGKRRNSV